MSDPTTTTPPPAPEKSNSPSFMGISIGTIMTTAASLTSGALGASPWGIAAIALLGVAATFGYNFMINAWNSKVDNADRDRAGADAGNTSVDVANQANQNAQAIKNQEQANPPTKGFPTK